MQLVLCGKCNLPETVHHVFMGCSGYESERRHFKNKLNKININFTINIFSSEVSKVKDLIKVFFENTNLIERM